MAGPEPLPGPVGGVPTALLGGPAFGLFAGDRPSLGPLLPVVLPFIELPTVVELAASPPEAELPPAVAPAPLPALCEKAAVAERRSADAKLIVLTFIRDPFIGLEPDQRTILFDRSAEEAISLADDSCLA